MDLSTDEYLRRAASYEKLMEDDTASREQRTLFAKKVNWLRFLARLAEKQSAASRDCRRAAIPDAMRPRQSGGRHRWKVGQPLVAIVHTLAERLRG
jgi:hypothetical protein